MESNQDNLTVFLSYSWDDDDHKNWVLDLSKKLIENGIDVFLDIYYLNAGSQFQSIIENGLRDAQKIVIVFTPNYKLKAEKRKGGVGHEYSIISAEFYQEQTTGGRIVPILRKGTAVESIPLFMHQLIHTDFRDDAKFDASFNELMDGILDLPPVVKPTMGPLPDSIKIKQELIKQQKPSNNKQGPADPPPSKAEPPKEDAKKHGPGESEESEEAVKPPVRPVDPPVKAPQPPPSPKEDPKQKEYNRLYKEGFSLKAKKKHDEAIVRFDKLLALLTRDHRDKSDLYQKTVDQRNESQKLLDGPPTGPTEEKPWGITDWIKTLAVAIATIAVGLILYWGIHKMTADPPIVDSVLIATDKAHKTDYLPPGNTPINPAPATDTIKHEEKITDTNKKNTGPISHDNKRKDNPSNAHANAERSQTHKTKHPTTGEDDEFSRKDGVN